MKNASTRQTVEGVTSPAAPDAAGSATSSSDVTPAYTDWGRTHYSDAFQRQIECVQKRLAGETGDALVFTEHEPVYTIGARSGADAHLKWNEAQLVEKGIEVIKTNRGGDITYHGPGQVVGYPIVSIEHTKDLHRYLRDLEQVLINTLGCLGLAAGRRDGMTGIWLEKRKIAAIGVAVRRWVTYHGFALNVNSESSHFEGIVPCGITDGTVTSMREELGQAQDMEEVKSVLALEFWSIFRNP